MKKEMISRKSGYKTTTTESHRRTLGRVNHLDSLGLPSDRTAEIVLLRVALREALIVRDVAQDLVYKLKFVINHYENDSGGFNYDS